MINALDSSGFVLKTQYDTDKPKLEMKINDAEKRTFEVRRIFKKRL